MRNAVLDWARLAAAFGIVHFHSGAPGAALGYAALPFFTLLLVMLAVPAAERAATPAGARAFLTGRAARLLGPWAAWGAVYGGLKAAEVVLAARPAAETFAPWMLLTGPSLHLWFLPFAFAACLMALPVARIAALPGGQMRGALVAALALAALAAVGARQGGALPVPVAQWAYALPAALLGLAIGLARGPGLVAGAAVCIAAAGLGWAGGVAQLALALAALAACLALPQAWAHARVLRGSQTAAALALGVYLAHPLVHAAVIRTGLADPDSLALSALTIAGALALAVTVAAGSAAFRGRAAQSPATVAPPQTMRAPAPITAPITAPVSARATARA